MTILEVGSTSFKAFVQGTIDNRNVFSATMHPTTVTLGYQNTVGARAVGWAGWSTRGEVLRNTHTRQCARGRRRGAGSASLRSPSAEAPSPPSR